MEGVTKAFPAIRSESPEGFQILSKPGVSSLSGVIPPGLSLSRWGASGGLRRPMEGVLVRELQSVGRATTSAASRLFIEQQCDQRPAEFHGVEFQAVAVVC